MSLQIIRKGNYFQCQQRSVQTQSKGLSDRSWKQLGEDTEVINPYISPSKMLKQELQSDSIIEQISSEKNYFDSFNRSFDYMSIGSEQACSPTSPQYGQFISPTKPIADERHNSFHSLDGPSFSTQENSLNYMTYEETSAGKHFGSYGFVKLPKMRQSNFCKPHMPYCAGRWPPHHEINDEMQLLAELDNMCGNQVVSRKIQKIFEQGRSEQRELIFNKVERQCVQFSKDVFGNYLIQCILDRGTQQQVSKLFSKLRPHIYELAKNNFGCRVVQKMKTLSLSNHEPMTNQFLQQIQGQVKSLIYDQYGNFVLLKCLEVLPPEKLEFMVTPVEESVTYMCSQQYGCKIILRILELYPESATEQILQVCVNNQKNLCNQEYGNHILQYAIRSKKHISKLMQFIFDNFETLCMNKYSSNTVEKLVEQVINQPFVLQMLLKKSERNGQLIFANLATHPYGNYVIKKFLQMSDRSRIMPIVMILKNDTYLYNIIRCCEYGQRIILLLEKLMNDSS